MRTRRASLAPSHDTRFVRPTALLRFQSSCPESPHAATGLDRAAEMETGTIGGDSAAAPPQQALESGCHLAARDGSVELAATMVDVVSYWR